MIRKRNLPGSLRRRSYPTAPPMDPATPQPTTALSADPPLLGRSPNDQDCPLALIRLTLAQALEAEPPKARNQTSDRFKKAVDCFVLLGIG
jgi:hypothetical protein